MKPVVISNRNILFTEKWWEKYYLNIGLIRGDKHNFIIDAGLGSGSVQPVIEYIAGDTKPVILVNTHCHWDHIFGNWMFENHTIIAHTKCRELIDKNWDEALRECVQHADGEVHKCLPNLLFNDTLYFPDDGVKLFFTPGHSEDCISVYDETDKVLYAGDNIGDTDDVIVPYIDTGIETFAKVIETYRQYDFGVCISGHNTPKDKTVLSQMEQNLEMCWQKQIEEH